jgi:hypothetical protein
LAGGTDNLGYWDGFGSLAYFENPLGLTVDSSGNIFIADSYYGYVREIPAAGTPLSQRFRGGNTAYLFLFVQIFAQVDITMR